MTLNWSSQLSTCTLSSTWLDSHWPKLYSWRWLVRVTVHLCTPVNSLIRLGSYEGKRRTHRSGSYAEWLGLMKEKFATRSQVAVCLPLAHSHLRVSRFFFHSEWHTLCLEQLSCCTYRCTLFQPLYTWAYLQLLSRGLEIKVLPLKRWKIIVTDRQTNKQTESSMEAANCLQIGGGVGCCAVVWTNHLS